MINYIKRLKPDEWIINCKKNTLYNVTNGNCISWHKEDNFFSFYFDSNSNYIGFRLFESEPEEISDRDCVNSEYYFYLTGLFEYGFDISDINTY